MSAVQDAPAALVEIAIGDLVRQHRESFAPLWTVESWVKLLIWIALRCGSPTDQGALEDFAAALGPSLSGRMRRVFFGRELEDLNLQLLADPAEAQVLALPLDPLADLPDPAGLREGLERVGLSRRVAPPEQWNHLEALIALPWGKEAPCT